MGSARRHNVMNIIRRNATLARSERQHAAGEPADCRGASIRAVWASNQKLAYGVHTKSAGIAADVEHTV